MKMRFNEYQKSYENNYTLMKNPSLFKARLEQLMKLESYHIVTMSKVQKQALVVRYQHQNQFVCQCDLGSVIKDNIQLVASQIKTIIWQVTKAMLQCQKYGVNHLKLCPQSIQLKHSLEDQDKSSIFIKLSDFSFGKEYPDVSSGKKLKFFQYLHPDISLDNLDYSFEKYNASWDIWSLGIILYYLIYKRNPFRKKDSLIFSKTILREYLKDEYQIMYLDNRFKSINKFIKKCLSVKNGEKGFIRWSEIKEYIIQEEEIYNRIDFFDGNFNQMAELHIKVMTIFSCIYCMMIQEINDNPCSFWKVNSQHSLHMKVYEFTLILIHHINKRFNLIYQTHLDLLQIDSPVKKKLKLINQSLSNELNAKKQWFQQNFMQIELNLNMVNTIEDICIQMRAYINSYGIITAYRNESTFDFDEQSSDISPASYKLRQLQLRDSEISKSMEILLDYCQEISSIIETSKTRMKKIHENIYTNKVLQYLVDKKFNYKGKQDFSKILKKIYR